MQDAYYSRQMQMVELDVNMEGNNSMKNISFMFKWTEIIL